MTKDEHAGWNNAHVAPGHIHKLSGEFARLGSLCHQCETITLKRLLELLGTRGHAVLTLFLSIPFLLPVPLPGLSLFFGTCIAIAGSRMAMGKVLWFPKSWMERPLSTSILKRIFQTGEKVMRRLEAWIKPRGKFFHAYAWVRSVNGILMALCGLFLALPLPPGTNFPPALALIFLSTGSLEEDGVFLFLGYVAFILNIVFFTLLPLLGYQGIMALWDL